MICRRFLRARRFDVNGAVEQFKSTEEWRAENRLDDLYANIDVNSYEEARRVVSSTPFPIPNDNLSTPETNFQHPSIPNGPATVTVAVSPSTSS